MPEKIRWTEHPDLSKPDLGMRRLENQKVIELYPGEPLSELGAFSLQKNE